jgi:hypothetical protein
VCEEFVIGIGSETFCLRKRKPGGQCGMSGSQEIERSPAEDLGAIFYLLPIVIIGPVDLGGVQFAEEDVFVCGTGARGESIGL